MSGMGTELHLFMSTNTAQRVMVWFSVQSLTLFLPCAIPFEMGSAGKVHSHHVLEFWF